MNVACFCQSLSWGVHGLIDPCGLCKKQNAYCDRGWVVWEGLGQHQAPTGGKKKRLLSWQHLSFFILLFHLFLPRHLFSSHTSSPLPYNMYGFSFKGRNNHSSSIRQGDLDLVILKGTWKAGVGTVCWYWIEHCFIVSLYLSWTVRMLVWLCVCVSGK